MIMMTVIMILNMVIVKGPTEVQLCTKGLGVRRKEKKEERGSRRNTSFHQNFERIFINTKCKLLKMVQTCAVSPVIKGKHAHTHPMLCFAHAVKCFSVVA